jgi:undecaprenyl-diphosphatase
MSAFVALCMGIVQGLTEFLPVSSSAHLKFVKMLLGIEHSENQVLFDLTCHFGTLLALLLYFRKEIGNILVRDRQKLRLLALATLPLVPGYFLLKPLRDFASQPQYLGFCLMLTAGILFIGATVRIRKLAADGGDVPWPRQIRDVLWIGAMQATALIPGISRSASTISCARVLGWSAKEAVRFSFFLSIPTIIGGNCLEALKLFLSSKAPVCVPLSSCVTAFLASFLVGLLVIRFALKVLEKGRLKPFAWYCLFFGVVIIYYVHFVG